MRQSTAPPPPTVPDPTLVAFVRSLSPASTLALVDAFRALVECGLSYLADHPEAVAAYVERHPDSIVIDAVDATRDRRGSRPAMP